MAAIVEAKASQIGRAAASARARATLGQNPANVQVQDHVDEDGNRQQAQGA